MASTYVAINCYGINTCSYTSQSIGNHRLGTTMLLPHGYRVRKVCLNLHAHSPIWTVQDFVPTKLCSLLTHLMHVDLYVEGLPPSFFIISHALGLRVTNLELEVKGDRVWELSKSFVQLSLVASHIEVLQWSASCPTLGWACNLPSWVSFISVTASET